MQAATDAKKFVDGIVSDAETIKRLSGLPSFEYDRTREAEAARLGVRVGTLDDAVEVERAKNAPHSGAANGQAKPFDLPRTEHWPEPMNGEVLLNNTVAAIRSYIVLSDVQADTVALWSIYTHAFDAFDIAPKMILTSAQKRSGKTQLVKVLTRTTARPLFASGIHPAALLRVIDTYHPTLLLDEMDAMMKSDREMAETLRGLLNSGFDREGASYTKNVPLPGGGWEPCPFSTWCPQVLAGIGELPDTVRDRSIEIEMKRKLTSERPKRLRQKDGDDLRVLGRIAARWTHDTMNTLRGARPDIPAGLNDRAADAWEPLFAIADLAEGDWPRRARKAALALSGDGSVEDNDVMVKLLGDICRAFIEREAERLTSEDMVGYLVALDDRPWPEWKHGKPITKVQLAHLLKRFKISSGSIRLDDGRTPKGYYRAAFADAFLRYLPPDFPRQNATPPQGSENCGSPWFPETPQGGGCGALKDAEKQQNPAGCGGVASPDGGNGESGGDGESEWKL
jgi:hypothetical protein